MTYLIFGIVVMLVTWWIMKHENFAEKHIIRTEYVEQIMELNKQIEELKSELIVQKAMRG